MNETVVMNEVVADPPLSESRLEEVRQEVARLEALGLDGIVAELAALGVRGTRLCSTKCPLAVYFNRKFPDLLFSVGSNCLQVRPAALTPPPLVEWGRKVNYNRDSDGTVNSSLRSFVLRFDSYCYLGLTCTLPEDAP